MIMFASCPCGTDVLVHDEGTSVQLIPLTQRATEWIDQNVACEPYQWLGRSPCVDHRFAGEALARMIEEGLRVRTGSAGALEYR